MRKKVSKKAMVICLIIMAAIMLYKGNTSIGVTRITVSDEKIPDSFKGFRILHISDFHNAKFGEGQKKILDMIKSESPDMIAITGDLVDSRRTDIDTAMELIDGITELGIPVYYVTGNHEARIDDYDELEKRLTESGVRLLRNEKETIEINGESITIAGADDPAFGLTGKDFSDMLKGLADENYTILLSHRPELFDLYCEAGTDLVLSGHAHGGQVRIPFVGGLVAPNQGLFPEYTEGLYEKDGIKMIVSRGLGNSIIPLRVNDPPELVLITLNC